jgi:hypothetical protein
VARTVSNVTAPGNSIVARRSRLDRDRHPQSFRTVLVFEFVDGETLSDAIARGPIAVADALPTARQARLLVGRPEGRPLRHHTRNPFESGSLNELIEAGRLHRRQPAPANPSRYSF